MELRPPLPSLVIDARAHGPDGQPLALAVVDGRTVLNRLVEVARGSGRRVIVAGLPRVGEWRRAQLADRVECQAVFDPEPDATVVRCDRLYDARRLRRVLRRGGDPDSAVLWRLDTPGGLAAAGAELLRRRTYQPLGQFWALGLARALARRLAPLGVSANAITLAAGFLMLAAAVVIASGGSSVGGRLVTVLAMAAALVLDTADGHLARLQGRASPIGRWLDATLDETADMAIHAAVAWAAFTASKNPAWLVAGMAYGMGKYVFFASNTIWQEGPPAASVPTRVDGGGSYSVVRRLAHLAGHADIRWHTWIVLSALGWLRFELVVFAAYYLFRALGGGIRKARGISHA